MLPSGFKFNFWYGKSNNRSIWESLENETKLRFICRVCTSSILSIVCLYIWYTTYCVSTNPVYTSLGHDCIGYVDWDIKYWLQYISHLCAVNPCFDYCSVMMWTCNIVPGSRHLGRQILIGHLRILHLLLLAFSKRVAVCKTTMWHVSTNWTFFNKRMQIILFTKNWWIFSCLTQYHGGTNFGRTTGGPFITTSYDYDAPIDEYGMLLFVFYGTLFSSDIRINWSFRISKASKVGASEGAAQSHKIMWANITLWQVNFCFLWSSSRGNRVFFIMS